MRADLHPTFARSSPGLAETPAGTARWLGPWSACIIALGCAGLPQKSRAEAGPPPASTTTTAEARLEALRHALIDSALKAPTRVRSAAWVDESGVLRENVHISSDIKVRAIRLLPPIEESSATSSTLAAEAQVSAAHSGLRGCAAPGTRLKRHAALTGEHSPGDGRLGYHFIGELAGRAEQALLAQFAQDPAWALTTAGAATSAYERLLADPETPHTQPYRIRLMVEAVPDSPLREPAPLAGLLRTVGLAAPRHEARLVRLSLEVHERVSGRRLWHEQALLEYPETTPSLERPPMPPALIDALHRTLAGWHRSMRKSLECEPLQFSATAQDAEQIVISAGSRIGVRVGDQLLLLDRTRFPGQLLEADTLGRAALIEVQEVMRDRAVAKRLAGPQPATRHATLIAVPL